MTMIDANEYLEQNYPKDWVCQIDESEDWLWKGFVNNQGKKWSEVASLNIANKMLPGDLDLSDFI